MSDLAKGTWPAVLVPFPAVSESSPRVATHCRSTVLIASVQAVKNRGWHDAYRRAIDPSALAIIDAAVAGTWIPIDVAHAHYVACDSLGISLLEQLEIGGEVVTRLQQTLLGTLAKAARTTGVISPLTPLLRFNELHARSWIGSGGRVLRLGPKDVRLDVVGLPLVDVPYFRASYRGFLRAGARFFAETAFVTEVGLDLATHAVSFRFAWV